MCYVQQLDAAIKVVYIAIDGILPMTFHPLKWGDYPQLITSSIYAPSNFKIHSFSIAIGGAPYGTKGSFRMGAVRVLISSLPDNPAVGEYIRTEGIPLTRGNGAGIGLPLSLVELTGYQPQPAGRPRLSLGNSTQIVGLASGSGTTAQRIKITNKLGINDVGYQYFDTDNNNGNGMSLWWSGTMWLKADGTPV
jgi:hypothetical protein